MISVFYKNIPFLTRMMQNWTKNITINNEDDKWIKKRRKDTINGYVHLEKTS